MPRDARHAEMWDMNGLVSRGRTTTFIAHSARIIKINRNYGLETTKRTATTLGDVSMSKSTPLGRHTSERHESIMRKSTYNFPIDLFTCVSSSV
jgi:hypothetical protein